MEPVTCDVIRRTDLVGSSPGQVQQLPLLRHFSFFVCVQDKKQDAGFGSPDDVDVRGVCTGSYHSSPSAELMFKRPKGHLFLLQLNGLIFSLKMGNHC